MSKTLKDKLPNGITARELDLSPEESKKRIQRIISYQKELKRSTIIYPTDLQKVSFPSYPINH